MGIYLNPGNSGFEQICRGEYVDKTGLIQLVNQRIDGPDNLLCISRPRRFGKSYAARCWQLIMIVPVILMNYLIIR